MKNNNTISRYGDDRDSSNDRIEHNMNSIGPPLHNMYNNSTCLNAQ
jgi:hypothetical protein